MIKQLEEKGLPPITLAKTEKGEIQVEDGHHRLTAIWLSGRDYLLSQEFVLVEKEKWRPTQGKIDKLVEWMQNEFG